ncbi:chromosomal replication initiator DnaA [Hephaestia sp. GCM10023244]|uniref:HdaA/DnaA family protein n=1 Tax=unclassified Hephaestia TaxID=2631281 RepID=UPI0020770B3B|nr:chromosomal replication initiator DnaA [Hephaestia sp. MAHUQ-44]MCM8731389.1 chromosomal replication initiator DnaA [Hephaestia sp. MAHUQ-44]
MSQIALPFEWPADPRDDEFLVSSSNAAAVHALEHWGAWPVMAAILVGPRKSGRSLLARIFAAKSHGSIIDDADRAPETELFHAWNRAQAERRPLLMVTEQAPPEWKVRLPDLRSRLAASPVARLGPPDDVLMRALLERQFIKRGLDARPDLIDWLLARIERSHIAVMRTIDVLDQHVLERRKRLSIPLARSTLREAGLVNDHATDGRETR